MRVCRMVEYVEHNNIVPYIYNNGDAYGDGSGGFLFPFLHVASLRNRCSECAIGYSHGRHQ
ncbi:hypothetical protein HJC23_007645 [Cyclotella cryptica]|uniref:Uncharacterized protein n=1 Tax=Cyclotella cryptica TaxID=29204 RepID=A0ABD3P812_9STRA